MSYARNDLDKLRSKAAMANNGWLQDSDTATVMMALNAGNQGRRALFVGGCVRDAILGRPVGDIDIATLHRPPDAIKILENKNIRVIPTGIAHGTVTAISNGKPFQITSLRKDVETFGRRAIVAFTNDWQEDAGRRDFTMNTLLADLQGNIYDPLGQGVTDLQAGLVRFVGDPETRIAEDYLRILRFFRFHAAYGRGAPDRNALKACRRMAAHVTELSRERITQEMLRIVAADNAADTIDLMFGNNVLRILAHTSYRPDMMRRLIDLQKKYDVVEPFSRLIVLAGFDGAQIGLIEKIMLLSRRDQLTISSCKDAVRRFEVLSEQAVRILIYTYKNEVAMRSVLLWAAQRNVVIPDNIVDILRGWQAPSFPLSGEDLKAKGITEGPLMGQLLHDVEDWWLSQDMKPDRAACLERALKY